MADPATSKPEGPITRTLDELPSEVAFKGYDPAPARERMRGWLAAGLVGLLAGVIFLGFLGLSLHWTTFTEMKELLAAILTPLVALSGTVIGFYFGGKDR